MNRRQCIECWTELDDLHSGNICDVCCGYVAARADHEAQMDALTEGYERRLWAAAIAARRLMISLWSTGHGEECARHYEGIDHHDDCDDPDACGDACWEGVPCHCGLEAQRGDADAVCAALAGEICAHCDGTGRLDLHVGIDELVGVACTWCRGRGWAGLSDDVEVDDGV